MSHATPEANRELLCGILALEHDFIDRDALLAALPVWLRDPGRPLGQILVEQGAIPADRLPLLDALVAEHLGASHPDVRQGLTTVTGPVPDNAAPRQADEGAQESRVAVATLPTTPGPCGSPQIRSEKSSSERYRIVRAHAKGGLGEVFVALDTELHREVALKEIQARHAADPQTRGRFLLEAEITGSLEHPGIVPVYGLGRSSDGLPYYTMRFIKGESLKEAVAGFHKADGPRRDPGERGLALRQLLGRFVAVCNAVAYAHSRGVLHRDVKPSNIMLGKFGETLVVDWGLAKAAGRSPGFGPAGPLDEATLHPTSGDDVAATQAGATLGTPAYMSPEQAAGQHDQLGPATDIYSLGATLYSLLTGQAPFRTRDRANVLERVQRGELTPPRRLKPAVPPALEAVCLKAMARRPEERYATALDLAADVEHWLADEPVAAYPESVVGRARRWLRRHRSRVASAVVVILAMLVAGGARWELAREREVRQARTAGAVRGALTVAEERRSRARESADDLALWDKAKAAAEKAADPLSGGEPSEALRQEVAALLAEVEQETQAARARRDLAAKDATLLDRLEQIRSQLAVIDEEGRLDYHRAAREVTAAFHDYGLDPKLPDEAAAVATLRSAPAAAGELACALDYWTYLEAEALYQDFLHANRRQPAGAAPTGGFLQQPSVKQSRPDWERRLRIAQQLDPDPVRRQLREAVLKYQQKRWPELANQLDFTKQPPDVTQLVGRLLSVAVSYAAEEKWLRRAQQEHPGNFWINQRLAVVLTKAKPVPWDEVIRFDTAALAANPSAAGVYVHLGDALQQQQKLDEAIGAYRQAIRRQSDFATAHYALGVALRRKALQSDSVRQKYKLLDEAIAAARKAVALRADFALAHNLLGLSLRNRGQHPDAVAAFRQAVAITPDYRGAYWNLAHDLEQTGEFAQALEARRQAQKLGLEQATEDELRRAKRLVETERQLPAILKEAKRPAGVTATDLARVCTCKGQHAAAAHVYEEAFASRPTLAEDFKKTGYRFKAACAAARAGCGQSTDAAQVSVQERVRWRRQAREWLRADLLRWREQLNSERAEDRTMARLKLEEWELTPDLAGVREPEALSKLPEGERPAWQKLWAEVRELLKQTSRPK